MRKKTEEETERKRKGKSSLHCRPL